MSFNYDRWICFAETDGAGVVFFANVLTLCHEAYEASLREFGIDLQTFFTAAPLAYPIVNCAVEFFKPIVGGEQIRITVTGSLETETEFSTFYELTSTQSLKTKARANLRHCAIDRLSRQRQAIPPELRQWLDTIYRI